MTDRVSPWVRRFAGFIPANGSVLDVACGDGRHTRFLASLGYRVSAVDRNPDAIAALADLDSVTGLVADLEAGPWPYQGRSFDALIVTNYLHRPLFAGLLDSIAPNGLLIYETFAQGNERYGRPSNPEFLLEPGELLRRVDGRLRVMAYEDLFVQQPKPALVQRICAIHGTAVCQPGVLPWGRTD